MSSLRGRHQKNREDKAMLIKLTTKKSVKEAATALQSAVEANHFGVMQVHNYKMKEIIVITALLVAILSVIFALRGDK